MRRFRKHPQNTYRNDAKEVILGMKTGTFDQQLAEIIAAIPDSDFMRLIRDIKANLNNRPLVLYGAGRLGNAVLEACVQNGLTVAAICDKRAADKVSGVSVIAPQALGRDYRDAAVIVCSWSYNDEIRAALSSFGFTDTQIAACPVRHPYFDSLSGFRMHFDGYAWAYDFFEDERSKALVLDKLRLCLLDKPLAVNTQSACYYESGFISCGDNEIFVDGGAYTGDTASAFMEKNVKWERIYSFEPDPKNYEKAILSLQKYANVELVQKGLWREDTELSFASNSANMAGSSFVIGANDSKTRVPVTSLDAFFADKAALPTFIKLDIEGAEKEALLGAQEIIRQNKPKLAVCAYHKPEDIYELPQTILNIRDDYRFCLRQHAFGCYDTVLYAV
jgi:FkbM family methyltransferase